jgi:hypothetical protein
MEGAVPMRELYDYRYPPVPFAGGSALAASGGEIPRRRRPQRLDTARAQNSRIDSQH